MAAPEELAMAAIDALNDQDWEKAVALATTGLLCAAVGALKAVEATMPSEKEDL